MERVYEIIYEKRVVEEDIPKLSSVAAKTIRLAIIVKLSNHPEIFGKSLSQSLKNQRALRVGVYRVIFTINKSRVKIFVIGHRKNVYKTALKRLSLK